MTDPRRARHSSLSIVVTAAEVPSMAVSAWCPSADLSRQVRLLRIVEMCYFTDMSVNKAIALVLSVRS